MFRSPTNKVLRVRFIRDVASAEFSFHAGDVAEIPITIAKGLVTGGTCEPTTADLHRFTDVTAFGTDPRHDRRTFNRERLEHHREMKLPAAE